MITIGIVEDETNLRDIVKGYLEKEGYKVYAFPSAEEARDYLDYEIHLWILDIMLPGQNGFDFMEDVKAKSPQVPVIFISARDQTFDRILGLEKGGEDYVTKPFSNRELVARVKANLRSRKSVAQSTEESFNSTEDIHLGDLTIHPQAYMVSKNGADIELTHREFELLYYLAQHIGQVMTREHLLQQVWGYDYFGDVRTVDVTVRRLREKIEDNPSHPNWLATRRGVGYYLRPSEE